MSARPESAAELVLAVDAGGTKTAACLARAARNGDYATLGRGRSGGANPLSHGMDAAVAAVADAVAAAAADAKLPDPQTARGVFSIAGAANPAIAAEFVRRARAAGLAERIAVVSDVLPVLAAGTDDGVGIALIAGTGSVAFGRAADGRTVRCGGWGYLLGDDGSGYAIGRAALRLALEDLETNPHQPTKLTTAMLGELNAAAAADLVKAIYTAVTPRSAIATLAPRVVQLADAGDTAARAILADAARDLAQLVTRTANLLGIGGPIPVAAAGGVLVGSPILRDAVVSQLVAAGHNVEMRLVAEPVEGCLRLATRAMLSSLVEWQ